MVASLLKSGSSQLSRNEGRGCWSICMSYFPCMRCVNPEGPRQKKKVHPYCTGTLATTAATATCHSPRDSHLHLSAVRTTANSGT